MSEIQRYNGFSGQDDSGCWYYVDDVEKVLASLKADHCAEVAAKDAEIETLRKKQERTLDDWIKAKGEIAALTAQLAEARNEIERLRKALESIEEDTRQSIAAIHINDIAKAALAGKEGGR